MIRHIFMGLAIMAFIVSGMAADNITALSNNTTGNLTVNKLIVIAPVPNAMPPIMELGSIGKHNNTDPVYAYLSGTNPNIFNTPLYRKTPGSVTADYSMTTSMKAFLSTNDSARYPTGKSARIGLVHLNAN